MIKGITYTTNNDNTATVSIQFETRKYAKEFLEEVYHVMNETVKQEHRMKRCDDIDFKIGGTD